MGGFAITDATRRGGGLFSLHLGYHSRIPYADYYPVYWQDFYWPGYYYHVPYDYDYLYSYGPVHYSYYYPYTYYYQPVFPLFHAFFYNLYWYPYPDYYGHYPYYYHYPWRHYGYKHHHRYGHKNHYRHGHHHDGYWHTQKQQYLSTAPANQWDDNDRDSGKQSFGPQATESTALNTNPLDTGNQAAVPLRNTQSREISRQSRQKPGKVIRIPRSTPTVNQAQDWNARTQHRRSPAADNNRHHDAISTGSPKAQTTTIDINRSSTRMAARRHRDGDVSSTTRSRDFNSRGVKQAMSGHHSRRSSMREQGSVLKPAAPAVTESRSRTESREKSGRRGEQHSMQQKFDGRHNRR
jgi:hypothetical protein